jgi:enamidase
MTPEQTVTAATGNVAAVYGIDGGRLAVGQVADLVVLDAPIGSGAADAFGALRIGDIPAVACVITDGVVRLTRSRNTPPPSKNVTCLETR